MPGNREQCRRCWERSVTLLKKIEISASILSADMANLTAVTEGLERDGLDMLHFDVMDGQFVPNITFGMPVLAAVDHCTNLFLDVHLMIADPIRYVKQFVDAGADLVTFHIESNSDPAATIAAIHDAGAKAGIVLKPGTPWEEVQYSVQEIRFCRWRCLTKPLLCLVKIQSRIFLCTAVILDGVCSLIYTRSGIAIFKPPRLTI